MDATTKPSFFSRVKQFSNKHKTTITSLLHISVDLYDGKTKAAFVKSLKLAIQETPEKALEELQKSIETYAGLQKINYLAKEHYTELSKTVLELARSTVDQTIKCELIYDILLAEFGHFAHRINKA